MNPPWCAAVRCGRSFFGIERDAEYLAYAENRILAERDNPQPKTPAPQLLRLPAPDNDDQFADGDTSAA